MSEDPGSILWRATLFFPLFFSPSHSAQLNFSRPGTGWFNPWQTPLFSISPFFRSLLFSPFFHFLFFFYSFFSSNFFLPFPPAFLPFSLLLFPIPSSSFFFFLYFLLYFFLFFFVSFFSLSFFFASLFSSPFSSVFFLPFFYSPSFFSFSPPFSLFSPFLISSLIIFSSSPLYYTYFMFLMNNKSSA